MRYFTIILGLILIQIIATAQNKVDLFELYKAARQSNPLNAQTDLYKQQEKYRLENSKKNFMPKVDLNGKVSYQSDVTTLVLDLPIPNFEMPIPPNDQYRISLDVSQLIYDGGMTNVQKQLESLLTSTLIQSNNVELYKLYGQINDLYFRILLLDKTKESLETTKSELTKSLELLELSVENDFASQNDLNQLKAESIKLDKKLIEIKYSRKALLRTLSDLANITIEDDSELEFPQFNNETNTVFSRPEHRLLANQIENANLQIDLLNKSRRPKLFGFGQAGYGQPGYNMFAEGFDDFYMVGLKLNWNIYDWKLTQNKKKIIAIEQEIISNKRNALDKNLTIALNKLQIELDKIEDLKIKEMELIKLREAILEKSQAEFNNGTVNSLDYIANLNAVTIARINLSTYDVLVAQIAANKMFITGEIENY